MPFGVGGLVSSHTQLGNERHSAVRRGGGWASSARKRVPDSPLQRFVWTGSRRRAGTATPTALAIRASGRHEGEPSARPRGRIVPALGRARDSGCYTDSGDGAGYAGPPMSGTTRHTYASKRAAPVRSGGNPRGAVPHARPSVRVSPWPRLITSLLIPSPTAYLLGEPGYLEV